MAITKTTDPRVALFKRYLQFFRQDPIELELPFVAAGASDEVSVVVPHNLGYIPLVIGFITFPSVQAADSAYTRFFGGSIVQTWIDTGPEVKIAFAFEEEITATAQDIIFREKITNNDPIGVASPAVTATIEYFILTRPAPPEPT